MAYNTICDDILEYKTETYCNIKDVTYFSSPDTDINLIHLNVRSISKNLDNLLTYLHSLNVSFDVVALSETNVVVDKLGNLNIPGYQLCYNDSVINKCDGFIFFIKHSIYKSHEIVSVLNSKFLRAKINKNGYDIGLTGIYRCHDLHRTNFIDNLDNYLDNLPNKSSTEVFCGDTNINTLSLLDVDVCRYLNTLNSHGFISKINCPTRIDGNARSCLDHFFLNSDKNSNAISLYGSHSDHFPILLNIKLQKSDNSKNKFVKKFNPNQFETYLRAEEWESVLSERDPSNCASRFVKALDEYVQRSTRTYYVKCKYRRKKPWITGGIIVSIRQRDKLKRLYSLNPNNLTAKQSFIDYRKLLTNLIHKAKAMYFRSLFSTNFSSSKETWKTIKQATNEVTGGLSVASVVGENGSVVTVESQIANEFNKYFCKVGENLAKKISRPLNKNFNTKICNKNFFLHPMSETEIFTIISSLKNTETNMGNSISNLNIKTYCRYFIKPLVHLTNLIFSTGIFPDVLKKSVIIPLFKSGSRDLVQNYRPIALIHNIGKVIEKCIDSRLNTFLHKNKLINKNQFGFRRGIGTEDALVRVANSIVQSFNNNSKCITVFLDLAKAFDTVPHHILLERLSHKGIRGLPLNLFKSYLENRMQQVRVGDSLSEFSPVGCGVPQGTVLGPVLFILYIDGIFDILPNDSAVCYADDTVLLIQEKTWHETYKKAESLISLLKEWFDYSLLSLNNEKSNFICYSMTKAGMPDTQKSIRIHKSDCDYHRACNCDLIIQSVKSAKYLGVWFDENLKWDCHTNYVCGKLRKLLYKFYILRQSLTKDCIIRVYRSLVESILTYGLSVWGAATKQTMQPLEVTQKRVLKIALFKDKRFSSDNLFQEAKVLNLHKLYIKSVVRLLSTNKIPKDTATHSYTTRFVSNELLITQTINFAAVQRSLLFTAPRTYNALPLHLKNRKFTRIKKSLHVWLLNLDENILEIIN